MTRYDILCGRKPQTKPRPGTSASSGKTTREPRTGFEEWVAAHVKSLGTDAEQKEELYELCRARLAELEATRWDIFGGGRMQS